MHSLVWLVQCRSRFYSNPSARIVGSPSTLRDLVITAWDRDVTDPRDYVFALAGLVAQETYEFIKQDYRLSLGVVFQPATVALLQETGDYEYLAVSGSLEIERPGALPSWPIDFSCREDFHKNGFLEISRTRERNSRMSEIVAPGMLPRTLPILEVEGYEIGRVDVIEYQ